MVGKEGNFDSVQIQIQGKPHKKMAHTPNMNGNRQQLSFEKKKTKNKKGELNFHNNKSSTKRKKKKKLTSSGTAAAAAKQVAK